MDMRIRVQQHTFAWFDVVLAVFTREFAMIQTLAGKPVEKNTWFKKLSQLLEKVESFQGELEVGVGSDSFIPCDLAMTTCVMVSSRDDHISTACH